MSATADASNGGLPADLRKKIDDLSLFPLWESRVAHGAGNGMPDDGNLWRWSDLRSVITEVAEIASPKVVERRVLELTDPREHYVDGEGIIGTITATVQMLKPGERARPHRHSMNAVRFVIESTGGAKTVVDGKDLAMEVGDLVLTPAWCWHAHVHDGADPVIWLDVLDLPIHRFLGTEAFQPGPVADAHEQTPESAFATPNIVPVLGRTARDYSPVFRYPWADVVRALEAFPDPDAKVRRVRYNNPATGGASLAFLDFGVTQIESGADIAVDVTVADTVYHVVEGEGTATVGDTGRTLSTKDIFTVPGGRPLRLRSTGAQPLRLFTSTNRPLFDKLGLVSRTDPD